MRFNTLQAAQAFVDRAEKIMLIVLSGDGTFLVDFPAVTEKMVRGGYEYAS
jgi:hypothetical protein